MRMTSRQHRKVALMTVRRCVVPSFLPSSRCRICQLCVSVSVLAANNLSCAASAAAHLSAVSSMPMCACSGLFRIFSNQSRYDEEGNWKVIQVKSLKLTEDGAMRLLP
jgi:hypothetical protein